MASTTKLSRDLDGKPVNEKTYRGMIGSLLYLTASRLNIMFSVCLCARFQSSPKNPTLPCLNIQLDTWQEQKNLKLWYPKGGDFLLVGYSYADYAGYMVDRKSTSGTCQFLRQ